MPTPPADQTQDSSTTRPRKIKTARVAELEEEVRTLTVKVEAFNTQFDAQVVELNQLRKENDDLLVENRQLKSKENQHQTTLRQWKEAYEGLQRELAEARNSVALAKQTPAEQAVWQKIPAPAPTAKYSSSFSAGGWAAIVFALASLMFGIVLTILHFRQEDSLEAHQRWMFSTQDDVQNLQKEVKGLIKKQN